MKSLFEIFDLSGEQHSQNDIAEAASSRGQLLRAAVDFADVVLIGLATTKPAKAPLQHIFRSKEDEHRQAAMQSRIVEIETPVSLEDQGVLLNRQESIDQQAFDNMLAHEEVYQDDVAVARQLVDEAIDQEDLDLAA